MTVSDELTDEIAEYNGTAEFLRSMFSTGVPIADAEINRRIHGFLETGNENDPNTIVFGQGTNADAMEWAFVAADDDVEPTISTFPHLIFGGTAEEGSTMTVEFGYIPSQQALLSGPEYLPVVRINLYENGNGQGTFFMANYVSVASELNAEPQSRALRQLALEAAQAAGSDEDDADSQQIRSEARVQQLAAMALAREQRLAASGAAAEGGGGQGERRVYMTRGQVALQAANQRVRQQRIDAVRQACNGADRDLLTQEELGEWGLEELQADRVYPKAGACYKLDNLWQWVQSLLGEGYSLQGLSTRLKWHTGVPLTGEEVADINRRHQAEYSGAIGLQMPLPPLPPVLIYSKIDGTPVLRFGNYDNWDDESDNESAAEDQDHANESIRADYERALVGMIGLENYQHEYGFHNDGWYGAVKLIYRRDKHGGPLPLLPGFNYYEDGNTKAIPVPIVPLEDPGTLQVVPGEPSLLFSKEHTAAVYNNFLRQMLGNPSTGGQYYSLNKRDGRFYVDRNDIEGPPVPILPEFAHLVVPVPYGDGAQQEQQHMEVDAEYNTAAAAPHAAHGMVHVVGLNGPLGIGRVHSRPLSGHEGGGGKQQQWVVGGSRNQTNRHSGGAGTTRSTSNQDHHHHQRVFVYSPHVVRQLQEQARERGIEARWPHNGRRM